MEIVRLSVIIPIYNEAHSARQVIEGLLRKRIPGVEMELTIVESNSTDGSREIVRSFAGTPGVESIFEDRPMGKGHAVRNGLERARGDIVLIQDADLEYSTDDYEKLLSPLMEGRTRFVLGTRHVKGCFHIRRFDKQKHVSLTLNMAHWVFTLLLNVSLSVWMTDPFTMYKVFRRSCLDGLRLECNRFDFDWELTIKLIRAGYKPLEIPVQYRSRDFSQGKKVSLWRDPPTWLRAWWKYAVLGK